MKLRVLLALAVCVLPAACTDNEDTKAPNEWVRTVEPRLTGMQWRERKELPVPRRPKGACETPLLTIRDAVQALSHDLRCIDSAIERLERLAQIDPNALSDLAAAYTIRAAADQQSTDLLYALRRADDAVRHSPASAAAIFNRALIQEKLGLHDDAVASYGALRDQSGWTTEARQRRDALLEKRASSAMRQWERTVPLLEDALKRGDFAAVARLIDPYPAAAQWHWETVVLRRWAVSGSREDLARASMLAAALSARLRDPYFQAAIGVIEKASPEQIAKLRQAHEKFAAARLEERLLGRSKALYVDAAKLFRQAGSPYALAAEATSYGELPELDRIARQARAAGYATLVARAEWLRAWNLAQGGEYLRALDLYEKVRSYYSTVHDVENGLAVQTRHAGVLTSTGQFEMGLGELLAIAPRQNAILQTRELQVFLGELAKVAAGVTPEVALHYRRATVQMLRNAVPITAPPDDDERLHRAKTHIAIALRSLAEVEAHLGELTDAATHLNEAERYAPPSDAVAQNILKARLAEVRAKMLLRHQPSDAVKEFTNAYDGAELTNYTFRATLLAERAEAQRNAGRDAAAERDLQQALAILAEEEAAIVKNDRGLGEPIWSAYFARFEDTYGQLIQQLVAEGRIEDAFHYAERARGFEPLQRILRLGQTPLAFKRIAAERRLSAIRRELPYGTFLLEYTVLKDRTITWIIWRDGIRHVVQDTTRGDVLRWTRELQGAAAHLAQDEFEARLVPPFDGLIARPLSVVRGLVPRDTTPRLVIVGDRVMQGLPMAALRSPEGRYLLQDAIVESQGSALLYIFSLMRNESMPADPTLLLVGDPQFAEQSTLAAGLRRLTAAKQEVHNIAAMHKGEAVVLSDADATIRNVLELARDSGIVHLALHGVVNARQPYRSVLLLAPTPGVDRGALEAQQLLRDAKLDRTRLVVLAACSSSGGAPVGPEGVGPLVRPILTAGVPAVLGTLWDVNDATARPVLVSFHRHFQMGSDAAKALREAQLELLGSDSALKRAVFWAPYQVIGHATSPYGVPQQTNKEKPP